MSGRARVTVPYEVGSGEPIDGIEGALDLAAWVESLTPYELEVVAGAVAAWEAAGKPAGLGQRVGHAYVRARLVERAAANECDVCGEVKP